MDATPQARSAERPPSPRAPEGARRRRRRTRLATGATVVSLALAAALGPTVADQGGTEEATPTATVPVRQEVAAPASAAPDLDLAQAEKGPSEHDKRVLVLTLLKQQQDAEAWFAAAVARDAAEAARQQAAEEAAAQEAAEEAAAQEAAEEAAAEEAAAEEAAAEEAAEEAPPEPAPEPDAPAPSGGGGQWDALAQCESGGDWSTNTGNGYYGGLQFSLSTWQAMGGSGMPHENSRSAQIAVAERVLASQGWGAWPSCASQLGLG